ncbi:MAG: hypothetical protein QXR96_03595 [Candidatus Woesearchaeota archaeon]
MKKKKILSFFNSDKFKIILSILALIAFILPLIKFYQSLIFILILSLFNSFLMIYERYVDLPIDLELTTFNVFFITYKYNLFFGILAGFISNLAAMIMNKDFSSESIFAITSYFLLAFVLNFFKFLNPVIVWFLAMFFYNLINLSIYKFVLAFPDKETMMYLTTNLAFNLFIFLVFKDVVLYFL